MLPPTLPSARIRWQALRRLARKFYHKMMEPRHPLPCCAVGRIIGEVLRVVALAGYVTRRPHSSAEGGQRHADATCSASRSLCKLTATVRSISTRLFQIKYQCIDV